MKPGTYNLTAYRDAKFPFQFTFQDGDEVALDLSTYTAVKYNFFTLTNQNDPEVTVEATVASNVVSGELTAAQTKSFYNKVIYYQGRFTRADGGDDILMDGRLFVSNVPGSAKEADAVVTVLAESGTVTVVGIISVAEAVAAKVAAETARDETIAAADQAIIDIGNSKDSAIVDINNARDTGLAAISDAETSGVQAVNDAKDSAITEINTLVTQAEAARDKANEWAENPEDTPVETGQFSALHWSAKSQGHAGDAETAKTGAETAQTGAETAKVAAETARDETIAVADQALIDIGNAKDSAIVDINNARDTGLTAISDAESSGVQAVNDAKDSAITEINTLVTQAEAARDKAEQWANEEEDVPVEDGEFSAKHYKNKAQSIAESFDGNLGLTDYLLSGELDEGTMDFEIDEEKTPLILMEK